MAPESVAVLLLSTVALPTSLARVVGPLAALSIPNAHSATNVRERGDTMRRFADNEASSVI
jgi:hypothetical protein